MEQFLLSDSNETQHIPIPIPLYVGVAIHHDVKNFRFGVYVHDGYWSYDFYKEENCKSHDETLYKSISQFLKTYQKEKHCKIIIAGLVNCNSSLLHDIGRKLWFDMDILPCYVNATGGALDEKACSAARKTNQHISPAGLPGVCRIDVGFRHEVEVDSNGRLLYCSLDDYKPFFKCSTWDQLLKTSEEVRKRKLRIVFFNSTPQGGGVAIIRHSTIRIFKMLGIKAHWFVMKPNPEVFEITKKKFHNVLQGVNSARLTDNDKLLYEQWCSQNVQNYWSEKDSPVSKADMIVIDDPQPSGMIKSLKKINPRAKFVYRSHIEIRSDLTKIEGTPQNEVWNYLWENIRHCDLFVSHPVESFIPKEVPHSELTVKRFPAVTDPCDGLNKALDPYSLHYYQLLFNRIAFDQESTKVNFARPYFIQISRFDPSKGIFDLIDAYLRFRLEIRNTKKVSEIPQLVITGHGSIDDPEGTFIYRKVLLILHEYAEEHPSIVNDIIVVRLGPSDQMLNAMLTGAMCAFQLSHREGFEVKVSEALLKGVPVVAYASGGIPLQIRDDIDGHLVKSGDISSVAQIMKRLFYDDDHLSTLKRNARNVNREWVLTPHNVLEWNKLLLETCVAKV